MNKNFNMEESSSLMTEKPIDWRELLEKYGAYWKWIIATLFIMIALGMLYFRMQPNTYQFKSTVLIADNSSSGQMNQISLLKQLDAFGVSNTSSDIYNERQILHSKELLKKVVRELKLNYVYSRTNKLKPEELYIYSPVEAIMSDEDLARIGKPMKMSIDYDGKQYHISGTYYVRKKPLKFKQTLAQLPGYVDTPGGKVQLIRRNFEQEFEDKIRIKISNPITTVKIYNESYLNTEVPKDGDLVHLTLTDKNIRKGQDILRRLIETYNQDAIDQINQSANLTALFIDSRLDILTKELTDVEQDIQSYKQSNRLTDIETDASIILERSNVYDQKRNEHTIQLQLIQYIEEFLKDPENKYALIPNLGLTDVGLLAVIQEYNKLLISRDRIASGSSENNPTLHSMESQIQSSRASIQNSIAISRKGIQISIEELENQYSFLSSQLKKIPQQEREFMEIKRQQEIKASLYMFLLQKREEASMSMAVTIPKAQLLDAADTADVTSPKLPMILAAALFLGLFIPIGSLYLKFLLTTTFNDRSEVETLTNIPVIAELAIEKFDGIVINHETNSNANAELLRLLRSKLQFILNRPKEKLMVVTSTESGEGKTFVAINLAISISLTGKKTLIIGMDLRKPMLAAHFGIPYQEGVSSYLSELEDDYQQYIYQSEEFPNLYILPGGIVPPNPNELILSDRFDQFINEIRDQYDNIIVDSAPVGVVSDTFLVNRVSNLTIYVCRANYSDKRNFEFLNRVYKEGSLKNLYILVNGVDIESSKYGGRYAYGYGYGHGKKKKKK